MTFSQRNLIKEGLQGQGIAHITLPQSLVDSILDSPSNGVPVKSEQSTNHLPGHLAGQGGQQHAQRNREGAFPLCPGDRLHPDTKGSTFNPLGLVDQEDVNSPQRRLLPLPLIQDILAMPSRTPPGTNAFLTLLCTRYTSNSVLLNTPPNKAIQVVFIKTLCMKLRASSVFWYELIGTFG